MQAGYLVASFDMLNVGDLDVIRQAAGLCDVLTVVVLSDESVAEALGRPPVVPLHERIAIVEHVRNVAGASTDETLPERAGLVLTTPDFFDHRADRLSDLHILYPTAETQSSRLRSALRPVELPATEAVA